METSIDTIEKEVSKTTGEQTSREGPETSQQATIDTTFESADKPKYVSDPKA